MDPIAYLKMRDKTSIAPPIAKAELVQAMTSSDIGQLGAVHVIISKTEIARAIQPSLSFEEDFSFRLTYLERCILENPDVEWADRSYPAAWTAASWIGKLWNDPQTPKSATHRIKTWLAALYQRGDERVQECLVNGALEHLFENKAIARDFSDWLSDPAMKIAYEKAILWSKRGGNSPLS